MEEGKETGRERESTSRVEEENIDEGGFSSFVHLRGSGCSFCTVLYYKGWGRREREKGN